MKLVYPAIFSPLDNNDGYCVTVPDLPGCVTEGENLSHSITMAVDAASGWVLDELEDGNPAPKASKITDIKTESTDDFVSLIVLDMDEYVEKFGKKAVRKNCTIPAWLNTMCENADINFSAVLQDGLMDKLHLNYK